MRCANVEIKALTGADTEVSALAALLCAVWPNHYGPDGPGDAASTLARRAAAGSLPTGWTAWADVPVGTVALSHTSFGAKADEIPWLIGLSVAPQLRGRGIGAALVAAAEDGARDAGFSEIYTTTRRAASIFVRRGWSFQRRVTDAQGHRWHVLALSL